MALDYFMTRPPRRVSLFPGDSVGDGLGFTVGDLVSAGGGTELSGVTFLVGSGKGVTFLLTFAFAFAFEFSFVFALMFAGTISSTGVGEIAAFALALTFAPGGMAPPDGIPSSTLPVGGGEGCTG